MGDGLRKRQHPLEDLPEVGALGVHRRRLCSGLPVDGAVVLRFGRRRARIRSLVAWRCGARFFVIAAALIAIGGWGAG